MLLRTCTRREGVLQSVVCRVLERPVRPRDERLGGSHSTFDIRLRQAERRAVHGFWCQGSQLVSRRHQGCRPGGHRRDDREGRRKAELRDARQEHRHMIRAAKAGDEAEMKRGCKSGHTYMLPGFSGRRATCHAACNKFSPDLTAATQRCLLPLRWPPHARRAPRSRR